MPFYSGLYDAEDQLLVFPGGLGQWLGNVQITPPDPPLAPTAFTPADSATLTTIRPAVSITFQLHPASLGQHGKWQFARDTGFTTGLIEYEQSSIANVYTTGPNSETAIPYDKRLGIGVYYVRAAAVDSYSQTGPWSSTHTVTVSIPAPTTPTDLTPLTGSTIQDSTPTVNATQATAPDGQLQKLEFQFATDAGFTANVKTVLEADGDLRSSGVGYETVPPGSRLAQGVWYFRARSRDEYGQYSSYTAANTITISHVPSAAIVAPSGGAIVTYDPIGNTYQWQFSDPDDTDTQTAYRVSAEVNLDGTSLYDSGKVASTSQTADIAIGAGYKDTDLRWRVKLWDQDDVEGNWSSYAVFQLVSPPQVTITTPSTVTPWPSGSPNVEWDLDPFTTQYSYRVIIRLASDNSLIEDTGVIVSTNQYHNFGPILLHATEYKVQVTVVDTQTLSTTQNSTFETFFAGLIPIGITVTDLYDSTGYIEIDWSLAASDSTFVSWHLYRRKDGGSWVELFTTTDQDTRTFRDYYAESTHTYEYSVTQKITYNEMILNSEPEPSAPMLAYSDDYWFINDSNHDLDFKLHIVSADSYSEIREMEEINLLGRGRKVNYGTSYGKSGSLSALLRPNLLYTAAMQRDQIIAGLADEVAYYMRDPFGNLVKIAFGEAQFTRVAGTGNDDEILDFTIPYLEVV